MSSTAPSTLEALPTPSEVSVGASPSEGARPASRIELVLAGLVVVVPPAGLLAALVWPGAHEGWLRNAIAFVVLYAWTGFGITLGYHRLFTHRSFHAPTWLRAFLAIGGSMALEGPVLRWVADHRRHHAESDREGDPHSPLNGGFWHSHVGWLFTSTKSRPTVYARDLLSDGTLRGIDRVYPLWMLLTFAIPFAVGWVFGGSMRAGLSTLLWAGCARLFAVHHVTWSINSICHIVGARRYASRDESRNVGWLALPSLGESWHNNHHAFPDSAVHGFEPGQIDLTGGIIRTLERVGIVSQVRMPSEKARTQKLLSAGD